MTKVKKGGGIVGSNDTGICMKTFDASSAAFR